MENLQKEDWYDDSEQGKKAIRQGIDTNQDAAKEKYDFSKSKGADFDWPDLDIDEIGSLEPWLCYQKETDGTIGGWQDLNAIPDGSDRKLMACIRTLSIPESCQDDYDDTMEIIQSINDADDFDSEAKKHGFLSTNIFSYVDHVEAVEKHWEQAREKAWEGSQSIIDETMGQLNTQMNANVAAAKADGLMDPVNGVSLEDWAAANAKIVLGVTIPEILGVLKLEQPQWDAVNAEWNGRMSRDTTFAIATIYGGAFQNSNIGKFAGVGPEGNKDQTGEPCTLEEWVKLSVHMNRGSEQGVDAQAILAIYNKTISDWSAIGAYWSKEFTSNAGKYFDKHTKLTEKYEKEFAGNSIADDINF